MGTGRRVVILMTSAVLTWAGLSRAAVPSNFFSAAGCVSGIVVAADDGRYNNCGDLYFWDLSVSSPVKQRLTNRKGHEPMISPDGSMVTWSGESGWGDSVFVCRLQANAPSVFVGRGTMPHWWVDPNTGKTYITYCTIGGRSSFPDGTPTYKQEINPATLAAVGNRIEVKFNGQSSSMRSGMSYSGRYFGGGYGGTWAWDFQQNKIIGFSGGCNPSMSPSKNPAKEGRMMGLDGDHRRFICKGEGIVAAYAPGNMCQDPEWSTHYNFMTCVTHPTRDNGSGAITVVRFDEVRIQDKFIIDGLWSYPHLWVQEQPSGPALRLSPQSLSFSHVLGGPAPSGQTVNVSVTSGTLQGLNVSESVGWLNALVNGNSIANTINTGGLTSAGQFSATVTVSAQGVANVTYPVTLNVTEPQVLTSVSVTPPSAIVQPGATVQFAATALDQTGNAMIPQRSFAWQVSGGGPIGANGLFAAGASEGGPYTVTASTGGKSGTASVTVSVAPPVHIKLNCGGSAAGGWLAEQYSATGRNYTFGGTHDVSNVSNPAPNEVYQNVRCNFVYNIPSSLVLDGSYLLRLHFTDKSVPIGSRQMVVAIQGDTVLRNFDVIAEAGAPYTVVVKEFAAVAAGGSGMSVSVQRGAGDDGFMAGLEIIGGGTPAPVDTITVSSPAQGETYLAGSTMHIRWQADTTIVNNVTLEVTPDDGESFYTLTSQSVWCDDPKWGDYPWVVVDSLQTFAGKVSLISEACRIRVRQYSGDTYSETPVFSIQADMQTASASSQRLPRGMVISAHHRTQGTLVVVPHSAPFAVSVLGVDGRALLLHSSSSNGTFLLGGTASQGTYIVRIRAEEESIGRRVLHVR